MTNDTLQDEIIRDLTNDFPNIEIEKTVNEIIIKSDEDTLWKIFEILYKGLDDVELNLGKEDEARIIIKT